MDEMEQDEDRRSAIEELLVAPPIEASLRLPLANLLSRRPSDVLQQIEAALVTYGSYFYPPENR